MGRSVSKAFRGKKARRSVSERAMQQRITRLRFEPLQSRVPVSSSILIAVGVTLVHDLFDDLPATGVFAEEGSRFGVRPRTVGISAAARGSQLPSLPNLAWASPDIPTRGRDSVRSAVGLHSSDMPQGLPGASSFRTEHSRDNGLTSGFSFDLTGFLPERNDDAVLARTRPPVEGRFGSFSPSFPAAANSLVNGADAVSQEVIRGIAGYSATRAGFQGGTSTFTLFDESGAARTSLSDVSELESAVAGLSLRELRDAADAESATDAALDASASEAGSISPAGGWFSMYAGDQQELIGNALNGAYHTEGRSLAASLASAPEHGAVKLARDGAFTYRPQEGFIGIDDFTVRVSTPDNKDSQIATVVLHVLPDIEPPVGPVVESIGSQAASTNAWSVLPDTDSTTEVLDGGIILSACRIDVDPTLMFEPTIKGSVASSLVREFAMDSLPFAADGQPGIGVVNVNRDVVAREDANGNWLYTESIYCSYSFEQAGDRYFGEYITRIEAFAANEVMSYLYASTAVNQSVLNSPMTGTTGASEPRLTGSVDVVTIDSTIVGYRMDDATDAAGSLEVRTQSVNTESRGSGSLTQNRGGQTLLGDEEAFTKSTSFTISRLDYARRPGWDGWFREGAKQESGDDIVQSSYEIDNGVANDGSSIGSRISSGDLTPANVMTSVGESGSSRQSHHFTILSTLRGSEWESTKSGVRARLSTTRSDINGASPRDGSRQAEKTSQSETTVAVEAYEMVLMSGMLISGTMTLSGGTVSSKSSSHGGSYDIDESGTSGGIELARTGFGSWRESSRHGYQDSYEYAKTFDGGDPTDPEDDEWLLSSGCSETTVLESTEFQDDSQGPYVKTILNSPGPEDDEVIEGFWDEGIAERFQSLRTVESEVDSSGAWVDSGSEDFSESGTRYVDTTVNDAAYSRSIPDGSLSGSIGTYEGTLHVYGFAGTRTLTDVDEERVWVLTAGSGSEIDAQSSGPSYDGSGTYAGSGSSGSGNDAQTWSTSGSVREYGRIGDGDGLITAYAPDNGAWQATEVVATLYNRERVEFLDTSTGEYAQGPVSGEITQRDSGSSYRWDAFVREHSSETGQLSGMAFERASLQLNNASNGSGEFEESYGGYGCGWGQVTYQREDRDRGSFRQDTDIHFILEEDENSGCGCGSGPATYSWRHESGTLEEVASREIATHRWTDAPQEISSSCDPDITERAIEFDETDAWAATRESSWNIDPEQSTLGEENDPDREDVWELKRGRRIERFQNDDFSGDTWSGVGSYTYDSQVVDGTSYQHKETAFGRTLAAEDNYDPVTNHWNTTYSGSGYESEIENHALDGEYVPQTSCGSGGGCGCGCGGGGVPVYEGSIQYAYSSHFDTVRHLTYEKAATQQTAYPRTIQNGPASFGEGCGGGGGVPSPEAWSSYGWTAAGTGAGSVSESFHVDHNRQRAWNGTPFSGTTLTGTQTESSDDTWSYSLTFTEDKALGTSPSAWRYTDVSGEGTGSFFADWSVDGSGEYQFSVKQGLGTLIGTKNYRESLTEENLYEIDFHITSTGCLAWDLEGGGVQTHWKYFDYQGDTGTTAYGGGNGTIRLSEAGKVESLQSRDVDWNYDGTDYQANTETTRDTSGSHTHDYSNTYSYTGCGYSYSSNTDWSEESDWHNALTKRHTFTDATWPHLWTDRFSSYEQTGCGTGCGSMGMSYSGSGCGCGCGGGSVRDNYAFTGCWNESYDAPDDDYAFAGAIDNQVEGSYSASGCTDSYEEEVDYLGFHWPTYTAPYLFDYVYPTRVGMLSGGLGEGCGCTALYGFETGIPLGETENTSATGTVGRLPSGGLIAPEAMPAAYDFHSYFQEFREVPESPNAARAAGVSSYREPNAIHGNGSPQLPQNAIFSDWEHWRDHARLNDDLEGAIDALANLIAPPATGVRPDVTQMPGVVVLDLYDVDESGDQSVTISVGSYFQEAATGYELRAPSGEGALVNASLSGGSLTISVPEDSTDDGLTAVTVVGKNADGLPVSWTVLVHVVAVEGYTVEEQAWGETTWDAPEDSGTDWALLWQCNDYRWLPQTTFDGLLTAANWSSTASFASVVVDSSRERWAYGTPQNTGEFEVSPTVTFGGETLYFETLNTASVGLNRGDAASAAQPRIAATYIESMEWEQVAYSREVEIEDYGTSTGMAKLTYGEDGYLVYPHERHHPEIQQPLDHTTVRVKAELGAAVPEGMVGTLHLAWYDPDNTLANVPTTSPTNDGYGPRDNVASLVEAGSGLPGFTLEFTTLSPLETSDSIQKAYLAVEDSRYGDNLIVAAHPHDGIVENYEFRENDLQEVVLMYQANTGLWKELSDDSSGDFQTPILTIMPSVDIDVDSDNTATGGSYGIERSDWEELIENEAGYPGKIIGFNNDDDNANLYPDFVEHAGYDYPAGGSWVPFTDDDLEPVVLDRGFEDLSGTNGFVFEVKVTIGTERGLSYWLDQQKTPIIGSIYDPDDWAEFEEAGKLKRVYHWVVANEAVNYPPLIYVEGINPEPLTDTLIWRLFDPSDEQVDEDTVKITDPSLGVDLDVDSDNNNGLALPDRSRQEETIEEMPPGKVIESWIGNDCDYDMIPDFADGYNRDASPNPADDVISGCQSGFVPMVVALPEGVNASTAKVKFTYTASDPAGVTTSSATIPHSPGPEQVTLYSPVAGDLRIWKKDAGGERTIASDYIVPNTWYAVSQLPQFSGSGAYLLFVEGIDPGDTSVKVTLDPTGDGNSPQTDDTVFFTVVQLDIDIDSDNDGNLAGSPGEDAIEDRAGSGVGQVGKRIFSNTDDDNKNGRPDTLDSKSDYLKLGLHDKDFAKIKLDALAVSGLQGYSLWLGVDGKLKTWGDKQKTWLSELPPNAEGRNVQPNDGINLPWKPGYKTGHDTWYYWNIGAQGANFPTSLYMEGYREGEAEVHWRLVKPGGRGQTTLTSSNVTQSRLTSSKSSGRAMRAEPTGRVKPALSGMDSNWPTDGG